MSEKNKEIQDLEKQLYQCQGRLEEIREEKKELNDKLKALEMMKMDLKLLDAQKLQDENNQIQHRIHITKKLLDEKREEVKFRDEVISDLEERGFGDYLLRKVPDNLVVYRKTKNK